MSDFDNEIRSSVYNFESKEMQYECFSGTKIFADMHTSSTRISTSTSIGANDSTDDDAGPQLHSPPLFLLQPRDDPLHQVREWRQTSPSAHMI
jgi:hypothetical protein